MLFKKSRRSKFASAYCWPDRIFIHSESRTRQGFYVATGPMTRLATEAEAEEIGSCILDTLEASQWDIDFKGFKTFAKERLKAAGFRSEKDFMRDARLLSVVLEGDSMTIKPFHNGGNTGDEKGFHEIRDRQIKLRAPFDPQTVGAHILSGWEICT